MQQPYDQRLSPILAYNDNHKMTLHEDKEQTISDKISTFNYIFDADTLKPATQYARNII